MTEWKPIKGDDLPFHTVYYRDVPNGFRLTDINVDMSNYPNFKNFWDNNKTIIDRIYKDYEINAKTLVDFYENITTDILQWMEYYNVLITNLENVLISKGYTTTRIKSGNDKEIETGTSATANTDNVTISDTGTSKETVLAFDSSNTEPSNRSDSQDNRIENRTGNLTNQNTRNNSKSVSETETITNVKDGTDFYEQMIKIYPNLINEVASIFETNFMINEVLIW